MTTIKPVRVEINIEDDIVLARKTGRDLAHEIGFRNLDCIKIATAISELARNIFLYAKRGSVDIAFLEVEDKLGGIEIIAKDNGPGIKDVSLAMRDGFTTSNGLGLGLPGTRRLMDHFEISSEPGLGTTIRINKRLPESI